LPRQGEFIIRQIAAHLIKDDPLARNINAHADCLIEGDGFWPCFRDGVFHD